MKHNCMTILKVSVALILALMMVVGSISTVVAATITIEQSENASDSTVTDVADVPDATGNDASDEPVAAAASSGAIVDKLVDDVKEDIADADAQPAQSAPLTDKLVRRVKDDIAGTGAGVDLAGTGSGGGGSSSHGNMIIYGDFNGKNDWNSAGSRVMNFVYESNDHHYYYNYYLNAPDAGENITHYFKFDYKADSNSNKFFDSETENDIEVSTNPENKTPAAIGGGNKAFKVTNPATKKIVWAQISSDTDTVKTWVSDTTFYLTGYLNGVDVGNTTYPFTETATPGVYTCTFDSTKTAQYVTIFDGVAAYHPETHTSGSGTQADPYKMDKKPKGDNKWMVTDARSKKIVFTWNSTTSTLSWTFGTNSATIYAKDGAAPINWDSKTFGGASDVTASATKYNYAAIATTSITKIDNAAPAEGVVTTEDAGTSGTDTYRSQYQTAIVETGKSIQITTTIADHLTWRSRYYVRGWCINGVTYNTEGAPGVNTTKNADGIYTMTYTIPEKISTDYLEITPIYYLQDASNCITFYLEGFDEKIQSTGGWGNTPYIYPFYGNNDNVDNSFGCYPGQPMVYADGKYSIEIPLKNLLIDSERTKHNKTDIKGFTISNGYADHVHRNLIYSWTDHDNDADHKQTYDYDDFYKIYKECLTNASGLSGGAPNSIIFRIIDESTTYNRSTYGGSLSGARVVATKNSLDSTDLININSGNGWDLLTNRYGDPIDIFGTKVTAPATAATSMDNNALRVVSTGYNANIAGDYGTAWKVYKYTDNTKFDLIQDSTNGRYAAPPSIFLLRGTESGYDAAVAGVGYPAASHSVDGVGSYTDDINKYVGIYKAAKAYAGKPVYITYEKNTQDTRSDATGTGAYRVDGRWYYTHSNDKVQSVLEIETKNKSTGNWDKDTFSSNDYSITTGNSGNKVAFSNNSRQSDSVDNDGQHSITFTATPGSGYVFDSWWIKYSETNYVKIEGAGATHTMLATASDTIVARFLPASSGDLTIKHTRQGTGEGTINMTVNVYTDSNQTTSVENGSFTGNYVNIPSTIINNTAANLNYYIKIQLRATPKYDGTVSSFTYDNFNANPSSGSAITATENKSATPATSTFGFTVSQLYLDNVNLDTTELNYVSIIDAEDHFYEFTYKFTDRGGTDKYYTTRGTIKLADYKTYVGESDHVLDAAFVKAKAPFESNFLMNNTLTVPTITKNDNYDELTKTFSVTSTFDQTVSIPEYTVRFKLPYDYYTEKNVEGGYKKYTVMPDSSDNKIYNDEKPAFDLKAKYDEFVTVDATIETAGSQTAVGKVSDTTDVNHVSNDFFTAPDQLVSSEGTTYYFQYWQIQTLTDDKQNEAPVVSKIYYPDLNYRIYGDYYIEPKYSDDPADWWHNTYINSSNSTDSSILYLGDSRNQWNLNGDSANSASSEVASDKIYSDFMLAFNDKGAELKGSSAVKIGMIIERVVDNSGTTRKWATGSADVSDMNYYKTKNYGNGYDEASMKAAILTALNGKTEASAISRSGCVGVDLSTANLNNKNYIETNYSVFSQYGQDVEEHSIKFATDNAIDNYVYRAYAVIKGADGNWYVSDPAYFCMRYTANLKYSE